MEVPVKIPSALLPTTIGTMAMNATRHFLPNAMGVNERGQCWLCENAISVDGEKLESAEYISVGRKKGIGYQVTVNKDAHFNKWQPQLLPDVYSVPVGDIQFGHGAAYAGASVFTMPKWYIDGLSEDH